MGGVRKNKVKNLIQLIMEKFNDGNYVFETTNEFPDGYEIWAMVGTMDVLKPDWDRISKKRRKRI